MATQKPATEEGSSALHCSTSSVRVPKTMMLMANGQVACFDQHDQQIIELQSRTVIELWAEWVHANGFDVHGCEVRTQLPGGDGPRCVIDGDIGDFFERWL